jgi:hypothetical protein
MISFDSYEGEIKSGLLLIANAIWALKGDGAEKEFLGFARSMERSATDAEQIDLKDFNGGWPLVLMYDFAYANTGIQPSDYEIDRLAFFIDFVPKLDPDGGPSVWDGQACRDILTMVRARMRLEDTPANRKESFSVRELALLADMSEGAVRNSLSGAKMSAKGSGRSGGVSWKEAAAWLEKRREFRPSPRTDTLSYPEAIESAGSLAEAMGILKSLDKSNLISKKLLRAKWGGNLREVVEIASALGLEADKLALKFTALWLEEQKT